MIRVNLIPKEYLDKEKRRALAGLVGVGAGIVMLAIGGFTLSLFFKSKALADEIARIENEIKKLEIIAQEVDALEAKKSAIDKKSNTVGSLLIERLDYPKLMQDVLLSVPANQVWFRSLSTAKNNDVYNIQITANAMSMDGVIEWLRRLQNHDQIRNVNLGAMTNSPAGVSFTMQFDYQANKP